MFNNEKVHSAISRKNIKMGTVSSFVTMGSNLNCIRAMPAMFLHLLRDYWGLLAQL